MTISVSGSQITFNDASTQNTAATGFGFKNRIINGAMMIDQRNAGASVNISTSNIFGVDRWKFDKAATCTYTTQQVSDAPTGYSFSSKVTVGTGAASASTDYVRIIQSIEGFNTSDLGYGSASAQTITLSFWVKSSITGTYCVALQNGTTNYSYPVNYTINSANTWEQKTVTIAGPTAGTWVGATNGAGIICVWDLGSGSNWNGTNATWQSGNVWKTSSQTALTATSGATFYITGVQLEKGSTATSFDYRPYGTELMLCQRYGLLTPQQQNSGDVGSNANLNVKFQFPVTMRATPTASLITSGSWIVGNGYSANYTAASVSISSQSLTPSGGRVNLSGFSLGGTFFVSGSDAVGTAVMFMSAEL